jgi:4-hydroxy-3-methylbut-2-en-1-yl diphosphate reductase
MKTIRAKHLGMCFGVKDAISMALEQAQARPLTVFGDLVHNETVLAALRQRGVKFQNEAAKVPTQDVMITAHGASEKAMTTLRSQGLNVMEATCPLVHHAHRAVQRLVSEGYHPIIVGKRDHVEVRGLTEDLSEYDIILTEQDVEQLQERPRFGVAAQTTQPAERVQYLTDLLRRRFPNAEIRVEDTVCQPTRQRQQAAIDLARQSEVVIVVGGSNSNNTRELANTCRRFCPRVYQVQTAQDLNPDWFQGVSTVGLTAGTSTPDATIDGVERWLANCAEALKPRANEAAAVPVGEPALA